MKANNESGRSPVFYEIGLEGEDTTITEKLQDARKESDQSSLITEAGTDVRARTTRSPLSLFKTLQVALVVILLSLVLPHIHTEHFLANATALRPEGGPVAARKEQINNKREAEVCKRWAGQSALVNGTLYYYGGRSTSSADQTSDTWNNNFIAIDLTKSWQISSPSITSLSTPSGPPPVSLGYLWANNDALFLYGGQFSDSPVASPVPFSLWSYDIHAQSWNENQNPTFEDGQPVQRAAEGAGVSVPNLGKGYYFGGHLDGYTTPDWSQSIPRVYLQTLLEYDMMTGQYRNITTDSAGFPERADGSLVYVPGYGASGVILGLAGGTNQSFSQMNVIDVYDIAESKWYKQATSGSTPEIRVNPCTIAVSAADGSSTEIYMFGGQNLIPYGQQKQYDDMWILTIPAFTWIQVDSSNQAVPPARAGHTCNVWNSQMVVVGGYVGQDLSCDSPGIYIFNTSALTWQNDYRALGGDPFNRQESQKDDPNALQGSYAYEVPAAVQSVIGGDEAGGATVTVPAQTPTEGPLATGKPPTYTTMPSPDNKKESINIGAIVAGVIAGLLFIMALYLAFCAWVYRKQLALYKNHVAMAQDSTVYAPFGAGRRPYSEKGGSSTGDTSLSGGRVHLSGNNPYTQVPGSATAASSTEDLMRGQEPSLLGIMLSPRRSLRVVNRD